MKESEFIDLGKGNNANWDRWANGKVAVIGKIVKNKYKQDGMFF